MLADNWDNGRIAGALPDDRLRRWERPDDGILIPGPPQELRARVFRDSCLVATERGWSMVVDAGIVEIFAGDGACALRVPADRESDVAISGVDAGQLTIRRLSPAMTSR